LDYYKINSTIAATVTAPVIDVCGERGEGSLSSLKEIREVRVVEPFSLGHCQRICLQFKHWQE